jgi:hypothetical protein
MCTVISISTVQNMQSNQTLRIHNRSMCLCVYVCVCEPKWISRYVTGRMVSLLKKRGPILGSSRDFYFTTRQNRLWGPSVFLSNGRLLLFLFSRVANLGLQFEYVSWSVDQKNICGYTCTCPNIYMASFLINIYMASFLIKHRDNITL